MAGEPPLAAYTRIFVRRAQRRLRSWVYRYPYTLRLCILSFQLLTDTFVPLIAGAHPRGHELDQVDRRSERGGVRQSPRWATCRPACCRAYRPQP
jgi:hypothetical protein